MTSEPDSRLTPDQVERLARITDEINQRYPKPEHQGERAAALAAAIGVLTGEDGLVERLADERRRAVATVAAKSAALRVVARMTVQVGGRGQHSANGEHAFAVRAGVNRGTVREWMKD